MLALHGEKPDRLPVTVHQWQGYHLDEYLGGCSSLEAFQRFGMDAPEMTTEELLPRITEIKLENDLDRRLRDFVHASDPIKFAARTAEMETMQQHFEFVREFVKKTTPAPADEIETAAVGSETNP